MVSRSGHATERLNRAASRFGLPVAAGLPILWPLPAVAEILHMYPTLPVLFGWTAIFLVAALLLARWQDWAPLLVLPFSGFHALGIASELFDHQLGPAILREGGWVYVAPAFLTVAINLVASPAIAIWSANRRARTRRVQAESSSRSV